VPSDLIRDEKLAVVVSVLPMSDRNAIALEWEAIDDPNITAFLIYRGEPGLNLTRIGVTMNRFTTHYLDTTQLQDAYQYVYRVSYFTKDGRESVASANIAASTLNKLEPISWIQGVSRLPRMGKIIFRPHQNERVNGYIIERRDKQHPEWKTAGTLRGRLHAEFIDVGLEDNTEYEYRVIARSFDGLKSEPSAIVITATKQLPKAVTALTASVDRRGVIMLKWRRLPNDSAGFYRIYASDSQTRGFDAIAELKATNSAKETIDKDGTVRFYKITYVDEDGLESPISDKAVQGATLPPELER
jgi:fibronectin type 3 domain-containing protein